MLKRTIRICGECKKPFLASRKDALYCGAACRTRAAKRRKATERYSLLKLSKDNSERLATVEALSTDAAGIVEFLAAGYGVDTASLTLEAIDLCLKSALDRSYSLAEAALHGDEENEDGIPW